MFKIWIAISDIFTKTVKVVTTAASPKTGQSCVIPRMHATLDVHNLCKNVSLYMYLNEPLKMLLRGELFSYMLLKEPASCLKLHVLQNVLSLS
jgi:hypothetical protein